MPLLEKTLAFNEARQRMLAENIANVSTPGYRARQLDASAFQRALRDASERRTARGGSFELERTDQFRTEPDGRLVVTPTEAPAENTLFKDGTNASIERQMSQLAEVTILHQMTTELYKNYVDGLTKAIRGRVV